MGWKFWKKEPEGTLSAPMAPSLSEIRLIGIDELTKLVKESEVAALNRHRYLLRRLSAIENKLWRKKELDPIDKPSPSEEQ